MRLRLLSALVIVLAYCALQYWWLPPDGFFTGDSGTKYLQARAVVAHGPLHPWIDGPALDVDTALRWQEPFLMPVKGHLVGVFSWLLALLTAPCLWLLGLHGLYVVPALSLAIIFLAASAIGRDLGQPAGGLWSGWCAVLATPLLVYGAELWEHAPGVALSTVAGALLLKPRSAAQPMWRSDGFLAAICLVLAAALRPEAMVVAPAFLLARAWTGGWRSLTRDAAPLAAGALAAGAILALMNHAVYGAVIPQQLSSNMQVGLPYWAVRRDIMLELVLPLWDRKWFAAGVVVLAAGVMSRSPKIRLHATHVAVLVMMGVGIGVPLWRTYVDGFPWLATFGARNLADTFPALCLLGYGAIGADRGTRSSDLERILFIAVALILVLVFLTMPHIGGTQWSARFFLPAAPFAAVLAVQRVRGRQTRIVAAVAIAASIGVQIYGLTFLRQFKRVNAQITHTTASLTQPGDVIVSDLFWYPEVAATLYPTRRLLFAWSPADVDRIAGRAADAGFSTLWVATATLVTGYAPPPTLASGAGRAPFVHTFARDAGLGSLSFHKYVRP